jgi:hypothetical protein
MATHIQASPQYIAGFFDGEGYITLRRSNRYTRTAASYRIVIGFTNKSKAILELIQQRYGGSIYPKARRNKEVHAAAWELSIFRNDGIQSFMAEIGPHIILKRPQVDLALEFLALGKVQMEMVETRGKRWPIFRPVPGQMELRESYKLRLGELNRRGPCPQ